MHASLRLKQFFFDMDQHTNTTHTKHFFLKYQLSTGTWHDATWFSADLRLTSLEPAFIELTLHRNVAHLYVVLHKEIYNTILLEQAGYIPVWYRGSLEVKRNQHHGSNRRYTVGTLPPMRGRPSISSKGKPRKTKLESIEKKLDALLSIISERPDLS